MVENLGIEGRLRTRPIVNLRALRSIRASLCKVGGEFQGGVFLTSSRNPTVPLLSTIYYHGEELEIRDIFLLVRVRFNTGS